MNCFHSLNFVVVYHVDKPGFVIYSQVSSVHRV